MKINCCAICGPGSVRVDNQDNIYVNGTYRKDVSDNTVFTYKCKTKKSGLFAVADGMGGGKHGELASLIAVEALSSKIKTQEDFLQCLMKINNDICLIAEQKGSSEMGTTFAGLNINGDYADLINIGDSRIFLYKNGSLLQLSYDHTAVQQMVDNGVIEKSDVANHKDKHTLTQYLGIPESEFLIEPYEKQIDVNTGDVYLLCSDGLTDMLGDKDIENILNDSQDINSWIKALYTNAIKNGGKDNISILLIEITK